MRPSKPALDLNDPQSKREKQAAILVRMKAEGRNTPDDLIAEAKKPMSPFHSDFQWDLKKAALEHWRDTARRIWSSFTVREIAPDLSMRNISFFVKDYRTPTVQGYVDFRELLSNDELKRTFMLKELQTCSSSFRKALEYAEELGVAKKPFKDMAAQIDYFIERFSEPKKGRK